jgi:AraC-like DNA-binding protein
MRQLGTESLLNLAGEGEKNRVTPDVLLIRESSSIERMLWQMGEPFYFDEGRLLRIVRGRMAGRVNLMDYEGEAHDIVFLPPRSIIEPQAASDDLQTEALVVKSLPGLPARTLRSLVPQGVVLMHLDDSQWQRTSAYIASLSDLLAIEQPPMDAVSHLIAAMVCDLKHVRIQQQAATPSVKPSRGEETFHRFLRLADEHGYRERNIAFYATQLLLTPNHLSAIVRQQSHRTVLDWLNERTLVEAKILLRHSPMMIYEIADRLHFPEPAAFGRFFKRETGMPPMEYRERG